MRDMLVVKDLWLPVQFGDKRPDKIDATIWEVMHMKSTWPYTTTSMKKVRLMNSGRRSALCFRKEILLIGFGIPEASKTLYKLVQSKLYTWIHPQSPDTRKWIEWLYVHLGKVWIQEQKACLWDCLRSRDYNKEKWKPMRLPWIMWILMENTRKCLKCGYLMITVRSNAHSHFWKRSSLNFGIRT